MNRFAILIAAPAVLSLMACSEPDTTPDTTADDFAARINGGQSAGANGAPNAQATVAPTVVPPREGAAPGAYAPGTATDPASAGCAATLMGPYLGRVADDRVRSEIMNIAAEANEIRFIAFGSETLVPDPTSSRLNLMLDQQNVIRDARCG